MSSNSYCQKYCHSDPWYDIPNANQDSVKPVNTPTPDSYTRLPSKTKESTGSVNTTCPFQPTGEKTCKSNVCLYKETDPSKCGYG